MNKYFKVVAGEYSKIFLEDTPIAHVLTWVDSVDADLEDITFEPAPTPLNVLFAEDKKNLIRDLDKLLEVFGSWENDSVGALYVKANKCMQELEKSILGSEPIKNIDSVCTSLVMYVMALKGNLKRLEEE